MGNIEGLAPSWIQFEGDLGFRPILSSNLDEIKKDNVKIAEALGNGKFVFPEVDKSVTAKDISVANKFNVRVYQPPRSIQSELLPLAVYAHGGGWALGDLEADDALCRFIAKSGPVVVVSVDYRLAPQYPYPTGLEDCLEGVRWALEHAAEFHARPDRLILAGQSAGGNLAIATALRCLDEDIKQLSGVVAIVPITCHPDHCPEEFAAEFTAYDENAYTPLTAAATMRGLYDLYSKSPEDPYISVLLNDNLSRLPKTYIAISEKDTLRDDARLFKKRLDRFGVPNLCDEYPGQPHYFHTFPSRHLQKEADLFYANLANGLKFVLDRTGGPV